MERVKIHDGTTWPNPAGEEFRRLNWQLRHGPRALTKSDFHCIAGVMGAYSDLMLHPAFTLKVVANKVSGVRNEIKRRKRETDAQP